MKRKNHDQSDEVETTSKRMSLPNSSSSEPMRTYLQRGVGSTSLINEILPINVLPYFSQLIYVPVSIRTTPMNKEIQLLNLNKLTQNPLPIDLSLKNRDKTQQKQIYPCKYCLIRFSSLETLHAHQKNYCLGYQKQRINNASVDNHNRQNVASFDKQQ